MCTYPCLLTVVCLVTCEVLPPAAICEQLLRYRHSRALHGLTNAVFYFSSHYSSKATTIRLSRSLPDSIDRWLSFLSDINRSVICLQDLLRASPLRASLPPLQLLLLHLGNATMSSACDAGFSTAEINTLPSHTLIPHSSHL